MIKSPKTSPSVRPCKSATVRTLLVDDSPIMLKTLASAISKQPGFLVVGTATDGRGALLAAASLEPDLVLMDFHLPHMNGAQVTRCLKQFESPPVVFMVTSDDTWLSRKVSGAAGADAFVVKAGDLQAQLQSRFREWFGPKDSAPPSSAVTS